MGYKLMINHIDDFEELSRKKLLNLVREHRDNCLISKERHRRSSDKNYKAWKSTRNNSRRYIRKNWNNRSKDDTRTRIHKHLKVLREIKNEHG